MNDRLIEILTHRPDFNLSSEDKKLLDFFAEYLDHGSLFLFRFEPNADPAEAAFVFTNEAQHFRFTMSDIRTYVHQMKSGKPIDWATVPFQFVDRNER